MKLLLHTCCAPCTIYPLDTLRNEEIDVTGFYYRHNIHPYTECIKREDTVKEFSRLADFKVIFQDAYDLENFLQKIAFRESERCRICYHERLTTTAHIAKHGKFDAFSTTLLYSKFQKHDLIRETAEAVSKKVGISFLYRDFRIGWKQGIEESKRMKLYRQQYCGCIYSEKERFYKKKRKTK